MSATTNKQCKTLITSQTFRVGHKILARLRRALQDFFGENANFKNWG